MDTRSKRARYGAHRLSGNSDENWSETLENLVRFHAVLRRASQYWGKQEGVRKTCSDPLRRSAAEQIRSGNQSCSSPKSQPVFSSGFLSTPSFLLVGFP